MSLQTNSRVTKSPRKPSNKTVSTQSLNHLLNFSLPPRQSVQNAPRRNNRRNNAPHVWNKERFVNAQYRFVMNPTGDYTVHFADPDIFFEWHDVLQIIIPRTSAMASTTTQKYDSSQDEGLISCPICLAVPTAPRMTKCGHVFCFPCILHLLSTSENSKWVRCPVCFDSVGEKHLKAVKWLDEPSADDEHGEYPAESSSAGGSEQAIPCSGSTIKLRLMRRPQMTTLALPRSSTWPSDLLLPHEAPFHFLPDIATFSKFMLATPEQLIADLSRDLDEIFAERRAMMSLGDELALVFVEAAEIKLKHQIAKATALESSQLTDLIAQKRLLQKKIEEQALRMAEGKRKAAQGPSNEEIPDAFLARQSNLPDLTVQPSSNPNKNMRQRRNVNPPPHSTQTYYFYQAASGLPMFLHPLDIKILVSHFNSYESFPDTINVKVEAHTEGTVNDDLRKRCKYLGHMPEGADVVFVEVDLKSVVGSEGINNFDHALKMRRSRRKEKGKKDDKAKIRAEEREREKLFETLTQFTPHRTPPSRVNDSPEPDEPSLSQLPSPQSNTTGAWGNRSFASALHSAPRSTPRQANNPRLSEQDAYDLDSAWHDLEEMNTRGGKKRNTRMVLLGGGGPGGARRR